MTGHTKMSRFAFVAAVVLTILLGCTSLAEQDANVGMINPMTVGGVFDDLFGSETSSERASLSDREKAQKFAHTLRFQRSIRQKHKTNDTGLSRPTRKRVGTRSSRTTLS